MTPHNAQQRFILLIAVLICWAQFITGESRQRYDGWYNNRENPPWGAAESSLIHLIRPAYEDMTYQLAGRKRPNARYLSNSLLSGEDGLPSYRNRTTMFVYIGAMVATDVVRATEHSCPVELFLIPIPSNDTAFDQDNAEMPFMRSKYNRHSGQSPNMPRKPLNSVTSWIDANFLYGGDSVWSNSLRQFKSGRLKEDSQSPGYPAKNAAGLPMVAYPPTDDNNHINQKELWAFGSGNAHMTPGLTALSIVWLRYHNYLASRLHDQHSDWNDEKIFQTARRRLIATWQNIVYYEWLPELLGGSLPAYPGYQSHVEPSVTALFEAAAFRFGHSMVPPGIYIRDDKCNYERPGNRSALRLCNCYWKSQNLIKKYGLEAVLLGMASQIAEREDHIIVEDMRSQSFGPRHFSRQDVAVLNIMRGRDHGLPDYVTALEALGLKVPQTWSELNPWLTQNHPEVINQLHQVYGESLKGIDIFPAGLLEQTPDGLGPLFRTAIIEQMTRLRNADRYWFENKRNKQFDEYELHEISNTTMFDVIKAVTDIDDTSMQPNVLRWQQGDPCPQPSQLSSPDLEECTTYKVHDYFHASEISYVSGFTFLFVFPIICIGIAYLIYKLKHKKGHSSMFFRQMSICRRNNQSSCKELYAYEWVGKKEGERIVKLEFSSDVLHVSSPTRHIRALDFTRLRDVPVWLSNDAGKTVALIHHPKEYDMVLVFRTTEERNELVSRLNDSLPEDKSVVCFECSAKYIYQKAVTKSRRVHLLTQFFRSVFAEAYKLSELMPADGFQIEECRDVAHCELSREEFAEALALTPDSMFVSQMFELVDGEEKGYISFRDMIHAVTLFTNGTADDKLKVLFLIYDQDRSGSLEQQEMTAMIKSMCDMGQSKLSADEITKLQTTMLEESGLTGTQSLSFEDFRKLMSGHLDKLSNSVLNLKGYDKLQKNSGISSLSRSGRTSMSTSSIREAGKRGVPLNLQATKDVTTHLGRKLTVAAHYIENNKQHIIFVFVFLITSALFFLERFYSYTVEQEHTGFRSISGYGISFSRGGAAGISFCSSVLLLTMCRNTITALRSTILNQYVPFDSAIAFHKFVAWVFMVYILLHVCGYCFNFYFICTQPFEFLQCLFKEIQFSADHIPTFAWWLFGTLPGFTGVLASLVIIIMYVFAQQSARTHIWNTFWLTHQLYYCFYVLIFLHGCMKVVQEPLFPYFFVGPAVIYTLDKIISLSKKHRLLNIVGAKLLPSNVFMIEFNRPSTFEYRSGMWIQLACPELGASEFHPFTLTSSPQEDTLSLHIRGCGPWTNNLRNLIDPDNLKGKPFPKLFVDGPFGSGQQDWFRYEVAVIVGAGIGVTPQASILKDFIYMSTQKNTFKIKCKKVYFIWVAGQLKQWEWMLDILREVEECDKNGMVETNIFLTQLLQLADLRTTMLYICEEHFQRMANRSMFTGLKAAAHFGRPNFTDILCKVANRHPKVSEIGVFSCGPPGMTKNVEKASYTARPSTNARFSHHCENF